MSYFDDASLVMIPSGYKASKVYSVKPTDGTGDLTFTRSNDTATRVGPDGLIEKVRTNLALFSDQFDNGAYVKINISVTANATTSPDGYTNADKIESTAAPAAAIELRQTFTLTAQSYVASIYLKQGSGSTDLNDFDIYNGGGSYQARISLNFATGVLTQSIGTGASVVNVGNGWFRVLVPFTGYAGANYIYIGNSGTYEASGKFVYAYGFQLEAGAYATDYIATTSAAVSVGPVANVPRLDYLGSSCPRLLLEPQRTNTALYSEQFTNAVWVSSNSTVVDNQAASPDGYTNADLLYPTTSGNFAGEYQNLAAGTTGVLSCYVKQAGKRFAQLGTDNTAPYTCAFDLQLGTVVRTATNYTGTITSVGNGWYRITAAYVSSAGAVYPFIGVSDDAAGAVTTDGTNGLYVYGFQYETSASYATSYIPTLGSASTRGSDCCF
jgi:hypothetical protein